MSTASTFADRLQDAIERTNSCIVAGFDPRLEDFPAFIIKESQTQAKTKEDIVYQALVAFYSSALEAIYASIAAIKPNIAFFEQYGLGGLRAYGEILSLAREYQIPVIADAKRGDIGSTATAYSAAFLGRVAVLGENVPVFDADAVTVNPFLGFDTLEPFLKDCTAYGKGIFVLVKTSNPGSSDIQALQVTSPDKHATLTVSEGIAAWLNSRSQQLLGKCGFSGLGAVVGATYPDEARRLRRLMPRNFFLIPGMGAQGGSAEDAVAGFARHSTSGESGGAIINLSRALFGALPTACSSKKDLKEEIQARTAKYNQEIRQALK